MPIENFFEGSSVIVHSSQMHQHLDGQIGIVVSIQNEWVFVDFDVKELGIMKVNPRNLVIIHQLPPGSTGIHVSIILPNMEITTTTQAQTMLPLAPAAAGPGPSTAATAAPQPKPPVPQHYRIDDDTNVPARNQYHSPPHQLPAAIGVPSLYLHPPPKALTFTDQANIISPWGEQEEVTPRLRG